METLEMAKKAFKQFQNIGPSLTRDLIDKLEKAQKSNWIKTSDIEPVSENSMYWVKFSTGQIWMCRLNDYLRYGGQSNYWQNQNSTDFTMSGTSYIEIIKPKA